jgi:hypothetical protein
VEGELETRLPAGVQLTQRVAQRYSLDKQSFECLTCGVRALCTHCVMLCHRAHKTRKVSGGHVKIQHAHKKPGKGVCQCAVLDFAHAHPRPRKVDGGEGDANNPSKDGPWLPCALTAVFV